MCGRCVAIPSGIPPIHTLTNVMMCPIEGGWSLCCCLRRLHGPGHQGRARLALIVAWSWLYN